MGAFIKASVCGKIIVDQIDDKYAGRDGLMAKAAAAAREAQGSIGEFLSSPDRILSSVKLKSAVDSCCAAAIDSVSDAGCRTKSHRMR